MTVAEHADPGCLPLPRYWVAEEEVERAVGQSAGEHPGWFLGYRRVARSTDVRSGIFALLPWSAAGDSVFFMRSDEPAGRVACLVSLLNSLVFDFGTRQKLGGMNFNFYIMKQLPVLSPSTFTSSLLDKIVPRVLELVYTAHDLAPFARDCGYIGAPFRWDPERRALLRAELDGIYAHLYQLNREDFAYILDTFEVLKKNEMNPRTGFGEYRTKRLCLDAYDRFSREGLGRLDREIERIELQLRAEIAGRDRSAPLQVAEPVRENLLKRRLGDAKRNAFLPQRSDDALADLVEYCDFRELQEIVTSKANWAAFSSQFGDKDTLTTNFNHLADLRNSLRHSRNVGDVTLREGEAAIEWFKGLLGLS
jgi:hypothetical protein